MAKKDLKYFMRERKDEIVTVPAPESFKDEEGNVVNLEIRVLSQAEIQRINDNYRKRSVATDKKGQPYIANGEVVFKTEKDNARATRHIIVEALQYPDLKSKELMDYYGATDVTDMPMLVFRNADEYLTVQRAVLQALGIIEAPEDSELVEDAKN